MLELINKNSLLKKLFTIKQFDEENLKMIYRKLCKRTHPDLNGGKSDKFLKVKEEYEEAMSFLKKMKGYNIEGADFDIEELMNPRHAFMQSFYYYHVAGLHSIKVRLKNELKERNREIIRKVIFWANLYDRSFIPIFLEYNRSYLLSFNMWRTDKMFEVGRKHFLTGISWFFDYQRYGLDSYRRVTKSFLDDALFELNNLESTPYRSSIIDIIYWLLEELEKLPVKLRC